MTREEAKEELILSLTDNHIPDPEAVETAIKALEQEPSGDLISRDAVIEIIHLFFTEEVDKIPTKKTEDGEVLVIRKCQPLFEMNKAICKRIKALPSASQTQNCVGNALDMRCEDAISRDTVLDAIEELKKIHFDRVVVLNKVRDRVLELQSVKPQPKTGHWIHFASGDDCSECGWSTGKYESPSKYCPGCGAKMIDVPDTNIGNMSEIPTGSESEDIWE